MKKLMRFVNKTSSMLIINSNGAFIKVAPKGVVNLAYEIASKYLEHLAPLEESSIQDTPEGFVKVDEFEKVTDYKTIKPGNKPPVPKKQENETVILLSDEAPKNITAQMDDESLNKLANMLADKLIGAMPTIPVATAQASSEKFIDEHVRPILSDLEANSSIKTEVEVKDLSDSKRKLDKLKQFKKRG